MRYLIITALALTALAGPAPSFAQERILTIYGKDRCPANTICVTAPESERYRIPKQLRAPSTDPQNQSWAARSQATLAVGSSSPTACTSASSTSGFGCQASQMRRAKDEAKQQAKEDGLTDNYGLRRVIINNEDD